MEPHDPYPARNPLADHDPDSGKSGSEMICEIASDARVAKAFSIYGFENFIDSSFPNDNV